MKSLKRLGKKIIIYIVIFMLVLSLFGSGVASAYTSAEVGSAVAGYTLNLLTWGNEENLDDGGPRLRYTQGDRSHHPTYDNEDVELPWYYDCSSFATCMYNIVCGMDIMGCGSWEYTCDGIMGSGRFEVVSSPQPGDLKITSSHVEIYLGEEYGTGGAHSNHANR
jgi:hypothetical protein